MSVLVILVGNVGTGKSTFCKKLKNDKLIVCTDNYTGGKKEKQNKFFEDIENGLEKFKFVVIDSPSITKKQRDVLLYFKKKSHIAVAFDFGAGNSSTLKRRIEDKPEVPEGEWIETHNTNQQEYQKPELKEGFVRIISVKRWYLTNRVQL